MLLRNALISVEAKRLQDARERFAHCTDVVTARMIRREIEFHSARIVALTAKTDRSVSKTLA